ncbi:UDP-N-acetyl-D-glucosamine dehydrogenase [Candidatus Peregrinibacteria bacterium CG11_big_fil_rev_8_21_14_0_20_46_8]|nr:MAG: UDP-N-acetyl-D-glucosamine dehydrogenase [Candidatus Peregrinibacteria bacterium CG11_big_fil_rev_8_21_14_0_20_46_8]
MKETVAILGLGYVGLPLAELLVKRGKYHVLGIDIAKPAVARAKKTIRSNKFSASPNFTAIAQADIAVVCVPTPVKRNFMPDYGPLKKACESIAQYAQKGTLVIIESTINPGTCEEVVIPIFQKYGLECGRDYQLAHCPERIDPGNTKWTLHNIPRNVAGCDAKSGKRAAQFYRSFLSGKVKLLKTLKAAEATKIVENTFRDINIAYVNELAMSFDKLGIDLVEVIEGAASKPFAFMPHYPGCGVGGHCIPVDPYYLIERAKYTGFHHPFLRMARAVNNGMPAYTVGLLKKQIKDAGLKRPTIGLLGLTYKKDIADQRESPAVKILQLLKMARFKTITFDPYLPTESSATSLQDALSTSDAIIIATNHSAFQKISARLLKQNDIRVVIDGRNMLNKEAIERAGILYKGIGR